jgi:transposase
MEVGAHSPWVSDLAKEAGHDVVVANPTRVAAIHGNPRKSDRADAELLARLGRVDPKLLRPMSHRGKAARSHLAILRSRDATVQMRTKAINHVRGLVKPFGVKLPSCSTESFPRKVAAWLPAETHAALLPMLATITSLSQQIAAYDRQIAAMCRDHYPETEVLQQIPGVGPITALAFVLTIEDPHRFEKSRQVGAYLGLAPRRSQSGDSDPQLGISKAGDEHVRRLLIQAAHYVMGRFGPETELKRWGLSKCGEGNSQLKRRAVTAVARKLAVMMHRLWISQDTYRPFPDESSSAEDRDAA